jgi:hypothetical protein
MSGKKRPKVVCLCGSTKFMDKFGEVTRRLTLAGEIVVGPACVTTGQSIDEETKRRLDVLHLRKIDLADYVFVLNVDGYIGESTTREVVYAMSIGKPIQFLEREPTTIHRCGTYTEAKP